MELLLTIPGGGEQVSLLRWVEDRFKDHALEHERSEIARQERDRRHTEDVVQLADSIDALDVKFDTKFTGLDARFTGLDIKFDALDSKHAQRMETSNVRTATSLKEISDNLGKTREQLASVRTQLALIGAGAVLVAPVVFAVIERWMR